VYQTTTNACSQSTTNVAMAEVDGKHGLTEKEYVDDAAHNAAGRGQTATDQYVFLLEVCDHQSLTTLQIWAAVIPVRSRRGTQA
jgi:hypothetical protein